MATNEEFMDGLIKDVARARELGLIPEGGPQTVSQRGKFIVHPSNIEELEQKRMRNYRFKQFPQALHGWGIHPARPQRGPGPISIIVNDAKERDAALAKGWSEEPLTGPPTAAPPVEVAEVQVDEAPTKRGRKAKVA